VAIRDAARRGERNTAGHRGLHVADRRRRASEILGAELSAAVVMLRGPVDVRFGGTGLFVAQ
jgi:hypothetical protein